MSARWPRKPPKDAMCDASKGWHSDATGKHAIDRCSNPATITAIGVSLGFEIWLCADCAPPLAAKHQVRLNPKAHA